MFWAQLLLCQQESKILVDTLKSSLVWAVSVTREYLQLLSLALSLSGAQSGSVRVTPAWATIPRTGQVLYFLTGVHLFEASVVYLFFAGLEGSGGYGRVPPFFCRGF